MSKEFKIKVNNNSGKLLYTIVDEDIYLLYKDENIGLDQTGYACFSQNGRPQRLHKLVLQDIPTRNRIYRKNNNKLDNRRENLFCKQSTNKYIPEYNFLVTNNGISKSFNDWLFDKAVNYNLVIAKYKELIRSFQKNKIDFSFSFEEFFNISHLPCEYCKGNRYNYSIGIKDLSLGYISGNLQSLCTSCKQAKSLSTYNCDIVKLKTKHEINKPNVGKRRYSSDRPWWLVKYTRIKNGANKRNLQFILTPEEYRDMFYLKNCYYCGVDDCDGIDRINSSMGYIPNNMVTCCYNCNVMKMDMGHDEFIIHIKKIIDNMNKKEVGGVS